MRLGCSSIGSKLGAGCDKGPWCRAYFVYTAYSWVSPSLTTILILLLPIQIAGSGRRLRCPTTTNETGRVRDETAYSAYHCAESCYHTETRTGTEEGEEQAGEETNIEFCSARSNFSSPRADKGTFISRYSPSLLRCL